MITKTKLSFKQIFKHNNNNNNNNRQLFIHDLRIHFYIYISCSIITNSMIILKFLTLFFN
jgi:hypothetical protein